LSIVQHVRDELVRAVDLRLHEPLGAGTDVALHAIHARVRAALVGDPFGIHRLVADLAAELRRLRVVVSLEAAEGAQYDKAERTAAEECDPAALFGFGKVEPPFVRLRGGVLDGPTPLRPRAEKHRRNPRDQETGRDDVSEDAEIRVRVARREIDPDEQREREQRADCEHAAARADPVVEMRARLLGERG
jgi:hypothetical protein